MRSSFKSLVSGAAMASVSATALLVAAPAAAQDGPGLSSGEIVVTARKREETALEVPVSVTALGRSDLENFAVTGVDTMARSVPSLIIGEGGGTIQGGIIAIRGIAGADNNPLNDQAVSFNIDGISIGRATVRRMGDFDTQQVEVLKGPQALFFGKNSPGGIISLRSADPTDTFEAKISSGYEFKAREWRTDAYISGPLSDSVGARIAGFYSDMKGWSRNVVGGLVDPAYPFIISPGHNRAPNREDWAVRGTLKFDDGGPFDAKLKVSYGKVTGQSSSANTQFVSCPLGIPQNAIGLPAGMYIDNCRADSVNQVGSFNPDALATLFPSKRDWHKGLFMKQYQFLTSLEMNYRVTDDITITSMTGLYKQNLDNIGNFTQSYYNDGAMYSIDGDGSPGTGALVRRWDLPSYNELSLREFSQEIRIASSFDGPINFLIGGMITDTTAKAGSTTAAASSGFGGGTAAAPINKYYFVQEGKAQSIFGQLILNPIPEIEITAGARASWEQKKLPGLYDIDLGSPSQLIQAEDKWPALTGVMRRKAKWDDVSPEFTIAYKPNSDLNIYAAYKEGFLSGGFSALTPALGTLMNNGHIYDQQTTRGVEVGIKAALLDRALRMNLAYYNYKTKGLQVGVTVDGVQQELRNAGSVRTEGVEFDFTYRTPLQGLSLNGAFNYNKGTYLDYQAACYRGQPSEECFIQTSRVTGLNALLQDLSGDRLVRAPRWTANGGFNYEAPLGSYLKLGLSGNASHSTGFYTDTSNTPGGWQKSYTLLDASVRLGDQDDSWELAFIGKNLTNKYYFVRSSDSPFTGSDPGAFGANDSRRLLGDTAAYPSRGRELWVRMSYKFQGGSAPAPAYTPPPPPPAPVTPPPPPPAQVSCNTGPYIVFFDWDRSDITAEAATVLDNAVTAYGNCANVPVMVAGHADRSGAARYNVGLSQRRADSVRGYLTSRGIADGAISTQAFGETQNRVPTADGVREPQNRRVEVTYGPGSGN